jgi:hypothetical protein
MRWGFENVYSTTVNSDVFKGRFLDGWVVCIPTNGVVKRNGCAVMGRGFARSAREGTIEDVAGTLGTLLRERGNHVHDLGEYTNEDGATFHLVSFPTKEHWKDNATLDLIERSARELAQLIKRRHWKRVYLPAPGCGNGHLSWNRVKPRLERHLPGNVTILSLKPIDYSKVRGKA